MRARSNLSIGISLSLASVFALTAEAGTSQAGAGIVASWNDGVLQVYGTDRDDNIDVSSMDGRIVVNSGMVHISGGVAGLNNTSRIVVSGKAGNDQITMNEFQGPLPDAQLMGDQGRDILLSGDGNDVLLGGRGNDILIGGRGNDQLEGQDGNDLLIWNNGDGSDFVDGGDGYDSMQIAGDDSDTDVFEIIEQSDGFMQVRSTFNQAANLRLNRIEKLSVSGQGGDDNLRATVSAASSTALEFDGGEGNDLLIGGDGVDVLRGGAGNDTLLGGRGNDAIFGENGNDLIIVNEGDGSDILEGGEGTDQLQVNGDAGKQTFQIKPQPAQRADGAVRFVVDSIDAPVYSLDAGSIEHLDVNGQGGSDVIIGSVGLNGVVSLDLDGGEGNDLLIGGDGVDVLNGGPGRDRCRAGNERDRFTSCEIINR